MLLCCFLATGNVSAAWRNCRSFTLSKTSAYRWLKHFRQQTGCYRSNLYQMGIPPPGEEDASLTSLGITIQMFSEASKLAGEDLDPFAWFQLQSQSSIL